MGEHCHLDLSSVLVGVMQQCMMDGVYEHCTLQTLEMSYGFNSLQSIFESFLGGHFSSRI